MKKHKNKIIAAAVIIAALAIAWVYGGNFNKDSSDAPSAVAARSSESPSPAAGAGNMAQTSSTGGAGAEDSESPANTLAPPDPTRNPQSEANGFGPGRTSGEAGEAPPQVGSEPSAIGEVEAGGQSAVEGSAVQIESESDAPTATPEHSMDVSHSEGQDRYQTDPVPQGLPAPIEPQETEVSDGSFTVSLTVRCDTILDNMNLLNKEKHELVPADGVIFPTTSVTAYEGESVFNVLQREMRRAGIHLTSRNTPIYNSAYIEAIKNLYEFDVGELSGWMYCVTPIDTGNAWYPNYGSSRYQLKPGDAIEWNYSCNLGRDLGESALLAGGSQRDE